MDNEQELAPETVEEQSLTFVGQWTHLVSTTNWEKGRIIAEWRASLELAGAANTQFSDEAWAQRVGGVSSQHVGRLRRVSERFADARDSFDGLYWSHFQAALEWNDAELWLEGAKLNEWSVSQMRRQRWQAHGAPDDLKPRDEDIIASEFDEDAPAEEASLDRGAGPLTEIYDPSEGETAERSSQDDDSFDEEAPFDTDDEASPMEAASELAAPVRPFADLPDLPEDLADAMDQMKLAILRQKRESWQELSRDQMLTVLDSLKQLIDAAD
jgi:hypothetical protein